MPDQTTCMQGCFFRHTVDVLPARFKQQMRYKPYTQKLAKIRQDLKPHKIFRIHGRIYVKIKTERANETINKISLSSRLPHVAATGSRKTRKNDQILRFVENAR